MSLDQLLIAARDGDKSAEKDLFSKLSVRFRLIAYRILRDHQAADDVAQESALDVLGAYRNLDVKESFAAWARVVVRNRAFKYIESQKRQADLATELAMSEAPVQSETTLRDLQRRLLDCLSKLSKSETRYGRILNFKHQGYSIEEICERLGINSNHAYVILHRARQSLKICLEDGRGSS